MAQGCRHQQGPGEQVEGDNTESAGQAVEADGVEACLARRSNTGMRGYNKVQRTAQISLGVADGRVCQFTEGEGDGSIKQSNSGMGYKIRR